jgi:16S rRNA C967 or C1407 C5-methylase (RsmB/RsmF family)
MPRCILLWSSPRTHVPRPLSNAALRQAQRLFPESPAEAEHFIAALQAQESSGHTIAWIRDRSPVPLPILPPSSWQPEWLDRVSGDSGAGRHPLHESGAYYCLDSSSVFASRVLTVVPKAPRLAIDLCASPGGKSVLTWRTLQPQYLLANEVTGKRVPPLLQNLRRCGITPASVCSMEPQELAQLLPEAADLVVVDAPCSGQSLIARGKDAPGCFHPSIITMNAQRQRRILAPALSLVAPGGHLAYITCTYAEKENEANLAWVLKRFPHFTAVSVPLLSPNASHLSSHPCYRLWPQHREGAGAFAVLFQHSGSATAAPDITSLLARLPKIWEITPAAAES